MFNCKKLFKLQIRPPSLILFITTSQDRWIFPNQSWEVGNSIMMMMMIIIIIIIIIIQSRHINKWELIKRLELRVIVSTYNGLNLLEATTSPEGILIGNFNAPGFDWKRRFSVNSCHLSCTKIYTLFSTSILSAAVICLTCSLLP